MHSNWAAKMIEAYSGDFAVVGGAIENGYQDPLNWAAYFCDFLNYQNPLHAHQSSDASDANISYKRDVIRDIQSTWQEGYHELFVHQAIVSRGWKIGIEPEAIVFRMRIGMRLSRALKERFIWGRHYAALRQRTFPMESIALCIVFGHITAPLNGQENKDNVKERQECSYLPEGSSAHFFTAYFLVIWGDGWIPDR